MKQETVVIIVGAGPAGIATSACLNRENIPNILLEREDCYAFLWKKRTYDRLKLHLAKQFCELPHMPFPPHFPTFVPRKTFVEYLDHYVSEFEVRPLYNRSVKTASFDDGNGKWRVEVKNLGCAGDEVFVGKFLVVSTGENSEGFVPRVLGLDDFKGEILHSSHYVNGQRFKDRDVLVVGSGNSGMEIAFDLWTWDARTSVVVRSPIHVVTKEMVQLGMHMMSVFPVSFVDTIITMLCKLKFGDLSEYGLTRPTKGPFYLKNTTGRSPVLNVGTVEKVKDGSIQVCPSVVKISGDNMVEFSNGKVTQFDAIIFATGYRTTVKKWLKDDGMLFNEGGMPKQRPPNHWKGDSNGLYCAGFARAGLLGISNDAKNIAEDIIRVIRQNHE